MTDDAFDDIKKEVDQLNQGSGIFHGCGGMDDQPVAKYNDEDKHYHLAVRCGRCGMQHEVMISWVELITVAARLQTPRGAVLLPPGWHLNRQVGHAYPQLQCSQCADPILVGFTASECDRYIKQGVDAGRITQKEIVEAVTRLRQQAGLPVPVR
jgi:hypothetical protein